MWLTSTENSNEQRAMSEMQKTNRQDAKFAKEEQEKEIEPQRRKDRKGMKRKFSFSYVNAVHENSP